MHTRKLMLLPGLLLAAATACSTDYSLPSGIDASDLRTSNVAGALPPTAPVASVTVAPGSAALGIGDTVRLSIVAKDFHGRAVTLSDRPAFTSSNSGVATVDDKGLVRAAGAGTATITASVAGHKPTAAVTVARPSGGSAGTQAGASTAAAATGGAVTPAGAGVAAIGQATQASAIADSPSGLSGKAFVFDDFTKYSGTAAFRANVSRNISGGTGDPSRSVYNDGLNADLAEIDNSVRYNGHATLRYNQPGGTGKTPEMWVWLPGGKRLTTMWLRAKIRFSPGFSTRGTLTNSANAYKLLGWGWKDMEGSGRVEITNTDQYQLYFGAKPPGSNTFTVPTDFGIAGNIAREWSDGVWYDYIVSYQVTSPTTATARVWMARDGEPPVLRATSTTTATSGSPPKVAVVMLGLNFNQTRAARQDQAVWYGQWEVVDGDQYPNPFGLPLR